MHIRIELDERDPPTGTVGIENGPERRFAGWLGLLGEMAALLDTDRSVGPAGEPVPEEDLGLADDRSVGPAGDLGGEFDP